MKKLIKIGIFLMLAAAAMMSVSASAEGIDTGDYLRLGSYRGQDMLWRCVGTDENGALMMNNQIICYKSFDAAEPDSEDENRKWSGSNLWSKSNIRCWLNSDSQNVDYVCGNAPTEDNVWTGVNSYDKEAGFLTSFTSGELAAIKTVTLKTPLNGVDADLADGTYKTVELTLSDEDNPKIITSEIETKYQNTEDRMFLLDCAQLDMAMTNLDDNFYCTSEIVKDNGHMEGSTMTSEYFLRTPNLNGRWAQSRVFTIVVSGEGYIPLGTTTMAYMSVGIRPAFYLAENTSFLSGSGTKEDPYIVSDTVNTADSKTDSKEISVINDNGNITICLNDEEMSFTDAAPFIDENGRTQIPVRAIAEGLGFDVNYDEQSKKVMINGKNADIELTIGEKSFKNGSNTLEMDTAAVIIGDRTYVPLRFVTEALGYTVDYRENVIGWTMDENGNITLQTSSGSVEEVKDMY